MCLTTQTLKLLENALLQYVFEQREQGINVSPLALIMKASSLSPLINEKHFVTRESAIKRFIRVHLLVYRMATHIPQCKPDKVVAEASNYMDLMHQIAEGPHHDRHFIINMDQTPVYFLMNIKRMLDVVGVKTIHIHTSTNVTKLRWWWLLS